MQHSVAQPRSAEWSSRRQRTPGGSWSRGGAVSAGTVAVRAVAHLIDVAVGAGIPRDSLMRAAATTEKNLNDPDARLPVAAEIAVWQVLAKRISDTEFGVRAASQSRVADFGLLGYIVRFSATVRAALQRIERYSRVFSEAVEFKLQDGHPDVALAISSRALGDGRPLAEDYRLAAVLQAAREITGVEIVPIEARFTFAQPSIMVAHRQFFRCPLRFGARRASVVFRASDLDLPVREADETLAGYLDRNATQVLGTLVRGETTRHNVRAAIWSLLGEGKPALDDIAAALNVAPRTIQRHLAEEGTSLQREIEEIRKTMALAIVRDRSKSVAEIAFLLGYAEPSSFYRSFRRWTGTTPYQFRHVPA